jgi:putative tricarboxylic transport membrane protein
MFIKDRIGGVLLLVFCMAYGYLSQQIVLLPFQASAAFHARTLPEALTVLGIGLSVALIIFPGSRENVQLAGFNWITALLFILLMMAYGLTIRPLGFIVSTIAFLMAGFALLGERRLWKMVVIAVPLVVLFWLMMTKGLDVFIEPFPEMFRE